MADNGQPTSRTLNLITALDLQAELRDLERDMRQLAQGLDHLEAVVPSMRRSAQAIRESLSQLANRIAA